MPSQISEPGSEEVRLRAVLELQGQFRDLFEYYGVWEKSGILYGGLAELIVNAMADIKQPFINGSSTEHGAWKQLQAWRSNGKSTDLFR